MWAFLGDRSSTQLPPHTWAVWPQVGLVQVAGGCKWGYPAGKEADLQLLPPLVLLLVVLLSFLGIRSASDHLSWDVEIE